MDSKGSEFHSQISLNLSLNRARNKDLIEEDLEENQSKKKTNWSMSPVKKEVPKIGIYFLKDIEKVANFYLVPDGSMKHQAIQTESLCQNKAIQTDLSLSSRYYDELFKNPKLLREFVQDFFFRQNLDHKNVLKKMADLKTIRQKKQNSIPITGRNENNEYRDQTLKVYNN